VRSYATYDEWGNVRAGGSHDVNIAGLQATVGYTTYTYDKVLDLHFAQYRFYDADNKRFVAQDPAKHGLNWYAYCGNNSLRFIDPLGLAPEVTIDGKPVNSTVIDGQIYIDVYDGLKALGYT
jgi:RHS repeat-associated protein